MSAAAAPRDLDATRRALEKWLSARLGGAVRISGLARPRAGVSNETLVGAVAWVDQEGVAHDEGIVVRIQPSGPHLAPDLDVTYEARVLRALAGRPGVPVPRVLVVESEGEVLDAPFFVMERIEGRIPADLPSWHARGWVTRLDPSERRLLCSNALAALVELHAVRPEEGFGFLRHGGGEGTALASHLAYLQRWAEWCQPSPGPARQVIEAALAHVYDARPDARSPVVTWGDARVGNLVFRPDLSVAAVLDWEGAGSGPPGLDLGWWVILDEFLCEAQGLRRLDGVPGREGTLRLYEALGGASTANIDYYEILAGLRLVLVMSRRTEQLLMAGAKPTSVAPYLEAALDVTTRRLAQATGRDPRR